MDRVLIRKYLFGRNGVKLKSSHFLSLVGIVIGVIALIVVSAVMNGLRNDMMERIIDTKADIRVFHQNREPIENYTELTENIVRQRDITSVSPIILNELLLHKGEQVAAVSCYGIDYYQHRLITGLDNQIRIGSPETSGFQENGIIIGLDLSLTLNATVGEYIRVSSPLSTVPTPFGMIPKTQLMKVVAIFVSGMPEYDQAYSYMSLANARSFSNYENEIDFVLVKSTKPLNSRATAANLQRQLGSEYAVDDWSVFDASLFQAMRLEKSIMLTVLALMLIISGFNMGGNSLRLITEKRTELGGFKSRENLLDVSGIGEKTYQQCVAFMRISGAENPLDNSVIHPEFYPAVEKLLSALECSLEEVMEKPERLRSLDLSALSDDMAGPLTLEDICYELGRIGRDPRRRFRPPQHLVPLETAEDLKPNMVLEGIVTNITDFGIFVSLGLEQEGLVHRSEVGRNILNDPKRALQVGDVVKVLVLHVDMDTKRIALSIRGAVKLPLTRPSRQFRHVEGQPRMPESADRESKGRGRRSPRADDSRRERELPFSRDENRPPRRQKRGSMPIPKISHAESRKKEDKLINTTLADQLAALRDKIISGKK